MSVSRFPIELVRATTANGGDEWRLEIGDPEAVGGRRVVGEVGVFTGPGERPENMAPRVLAKVLGGTR